jgi:tetratricopeptide (TPR) repeat protein
VQQRRYKDVVHFYHHMHEFMHIYGHISDSLYFLQWLIQAAERHGDRHTQVETLYQKAHTLIAIGNSEQLREAEQNLVEAWSLRHDVCPALQSYVADTFAEYYIHTQQYSEALAWVEISTDLVTEITDDDLTKARKALHTRYRHALCMRKMGDFPAAHALLTEVQTQSHAIGWSRLYYDAQNDLAEIALAQNDLATAETLLRDGMRIVEHNHDPLRIACYKRSLAMLAQHHAQPSSARRLAQEAHLIFNRLGMQTDTNIVNDFLQLVAAD